MISAVLMRGYMQSAQLTPWGDHRLCLTSTSRPWATES
jgi:hypothetical protein